MNENEDKLVLDQVASKGYGIVYKLPMQDKDLDVVAKAFYAYICSFAGAGDTAFPGMDKICHELGVSRQRLERHRKVLVEKGYITINQVKDKGKFKRNEYRINKDIKPLLQNATTDDVTTDSVTSENVTSQNVTINNNIFNNNSINNNKDNSKEEKELAKLEKARLKKEQEDKVENDFNEYYEYYPKKDGRKKALEAYKKLIKEGKEHQKIMEGLVRYINYLDANETELKFVKGAAPFLNQEAFNEKWEFEVKKIVQAELKPWEVAAYGQEPGRTNYDDDRSIVQQQIKIEQPKFNI